MRRLPAVLLALFLLFSAASADSSAGETTLLCLNIGKADCMLLTTGGRHYLIDAGYSQTWPALETALAQYGVDSLDGVFLTHCHKDHYGGLLPLAQSGISVGAWYASSIYFDIDKEGHPAVLAAGARGQEVTWLASGQTVDAGDGASFTVLGPLGTDEDNENNNSLVMLFSSPDGDILFCGDMKSDEAADLMDAGLIAPCALLKFPHHGDNKTISSKFLKACSPQAAVILTSTYEEPDTPAPSVLSMLKDAGCAVYVSQDFQDAALFTLSGGGVVSVQDISWDGVPPRVSGIGLSVDLSDDTVTVSCSGDEAVSLAGCVLYSSKGDETLQLPDTELLPGDFLVIGSRSTDGSADIIWNEKRVWNRKKRDVAILYDPYGRPAAFADNGLDE